MSSPNSNLKNIDDINFSKKITPVFDPKQNFRNISNSGLNTEYSTSKIISITENRESSFSKINPLDLNYNKKEIKDSKAPNLNIDKNSYIKVYSSQELNFDDIPKTNESSNLVIVKAMGHNVLHPDLAALKNGLKLNDIIINFYLKLISNSSNHYKCSTIDSLVSNKILTNSLREISSLLDEDNFREMKNFKSIEEKWNYFKDTILKIIENVAPVRKINIKTSNRFPWDDDEIILAKHLRDSSFKKYKRSYSIEDKNLYNLYNK
ncbi:unnamed protein product [Brachionus calyciflorus]|uniref:Uncharacterized protein n=1 Tax=Brachionus calyciflorus TaxID=104777 RepID=A0A814ED47_9BILA|nr:unnamed protein product [Brachionus calyciflorus]